MYALWFIIFELFLFVFVHNYQIYHNVHAVFVAVKKPLVFNLLILSLKDQTYIFKFVAFDLNNKWINWYLHMFLCGLF